MNYVPPFRTCDIANGDGVRVTVFVTGCRRKCKHCFNKEAQDFNYGVLFTDDVINDVLQAADKDYIAGLSILGGEPMEPENQPRVLDLVNAFRDKFGGSKTIWLYTGYVIDIHLLRGGLKYVEGITADLLANVDDVVDGPFVESMKDPSLRFRGSYNQRILKTFVDFDPYGTKCRTL